MFASGCQDPVICFIQTYLYMHYGWCDAFNQRRSVWISYETLLSV